MFNLPSRSYGQPSGWPSSKPLSQTVRVYDRNPSAYFDHDETATTCNDAIHYRRALMDGAA